MSTTRESDTDGLDALLAVARTEAPAPLTPAFEARLLADAQAALPDPAPGPGWLAWLGAALSGIGGAPGLAGMGAAGIAGVWIGFAGPGPATELASGVWDLALRSPDLSGFYPADEDQGLLDLIAGDSE